VKAIGQHPLDVPEDTLNQHKTGLIGIIHIETNLLYNIRQVEPSKCKILQSDDEALILCQMSNRRAVSERELYMSVNKILQSDDEALVEESDCSTPMEDSVIVVETTRGGTTSFVIKKIERVQGWGRGGCEGQTCSLKTT
jgi:hypothetical protein